MTAAPRSRLLRTSLSPPRRQLQESTRKIWYVMCAVVAELSKARAVGRCPLIAGQ